MLRALLASGCIHRPTGDAANSVVTPSQHIDAQLARLSAYRQCRRCSQRPEAVSDSSSEDHVTVSHVNSAVCLISPKDVCQMLSHAIISEPCHEAKRSTPLLNIVRTPATAAGA